MKKLLVAVLVVAMGCVFYRKLVAEQDERDLWTEVTDEVD